MTYEGEVIGAIAVMFFSVIIIVFLLLCISYISRSFDDYNTLKSKKLKEQKIAEQKDRELITQAKKHTQQYSDKIIKDLKSNEKKYDFDVDFSLNINNSTIRTEVVYAE